MPICELQACGSLVFTPDSHWPASHWLGDFYAKREPRLSPNFVVYENNAEKLADQIRNTAANADHLHVRATFEQHQPSMLRGDRKAVRVFLESVSSGQIHARLHREHAEVGR